MLGMRDQWLVHGVGIATMRAVRYKLLAPVGTGKIKKEGTVVDLLFDLPYLIGWGAPIPSRTALNALFATGHYDAGMSGGCEWKQPFELSEDEYREVVEAIRQDPRLQDCPVPSVWGEIGLRHGR